jgi:hypothetical protein
MTITKQPDPRSTPAAITDARRMLDRIPITGMPYGVYVDGGIVSCGRTRQDTATAAHWWRATYPGRVRVRKRRPDDRVMGESA